MPSDTFKELFNVTTASNIATFSTTASPGAGKAWIIGRLNIANPTTGAVFAIKSNSGVFLTGGGTAGESVSDNSHDWWKGVILNTTDTLSISSSSAMTFVAYGIERTY